MFDCHQPEEIFWRRMNPARLHALFDARVQFLRETKKQEPAKMSLQEYLRGG